MAASIKCIMALAVAGHEPMLQSQHFMEEFGVDPLPTFREMLAVASAATACMSRSLERAAHGDLTRQCLVATNAKGQRCCLCLGMYCALA